MAVYLIDWNLVQTLDDLKAIVRTFSPSSVYVANSGELEQTYPLVVPYVVLVPEPPAVPAPEPPPEQRRVVAPAQQKPELPPK
jgi:hypothetical protein